MTSTLLLAASIGLVMLSIVVVTGWVGYRLGKASGTTERVTVPDQVTKELMTTLTRRKLDFGLSSIVSSPPASSNSSCPKCNSADVDPKSSPALECKSCGNCWIL